MVIGILALLVFSNVAQWILFAYVCKWQETTDEELNIIGYNIENFDDRMKLLEK